MAVSLNSVVGFNSKNLQERIKQQQQRCDYVQARINGNLVVTWRRRKVENLCISSSSSVVSSAAEKDEDSEEDNKGVENGGDKRATTRRSGLTARERLRAARVVSKYSEAKSSAKTEMGSNVLDAIRRESSDGKGSRRRRSRLPEAPTNMLDDSKRGMPKQGLTFDFPGGADLFVILVSFILISTIMFATTYFVWKLGAIHFND